MNFLLIGIPFVFGTIIGSFLNVLVYRSNTNLTLGGRSKCGSCSKTLSWLELIPIASFFIQSRRCRGCQSRISWQYPIVEFVTGCLYVLIFNKFFYLLISGNTVSYTMTLLYYLLVISILIVISVYDIRHKIIPDKFVYSFIGISLLGSFFLGGVFHLPWIGDALAGIIISLPFALLWFFSDGRLMGFGDVKLMMGMGFLLGLSGGIAAIMLSFWIGALASLILMIIKGRSFTMKTQIPFAPFLILGTVLVFLYDIDVITLSRLFQWN